MIILFLVFVVQFSVSSACLAINEEQQVRLTTVLHYDILINPLFSLRNVLQI